MISDDRARRQILKMLATMDDVLILEMFDSIRTREQATHLLNQLEQEGRVEFYDDRNSVGLTSKGRAYIAGGCVESAAPITYQTTVHGTVGAIGSNNVVAVHQEISDALQKIQRLDIPPQVKQRESNKLLQGIKDFTAKFLAEVLARKAGGEF
jgi:hypothetical protein